MSFGRKWLSAAALLVTAFVGGGCGDDDKPVVQSGGGLRDPIDGNVACAQRVWPDRTAGMSVSKGEYSVTVDAAQLSFWANSPGQKVRTGILKGYYGWKVPAWVTFDRSLVAIVDPDQRDEARLMFTEEDRDVSFDKLAQVVRFSGCTPKEEPYFSGEKQPPFTGFAGAMYTREPALCLRFEIVSERRGPSGHLVLPLGRECEPAPSSATGASS
ncbi:MAG: hypothetical protein WAP35_01485 [Solirubrobacterales bacterium]